MAVLRTPLLGGPLLLLLLALLLATPAADAYPKLLVKEKRCASALTAGEVIMGQPVVQGKGQTVTVRSFGWG